jgi:hypothetical protein
MPAKQTDCQTCEGYGYLIGADGGTKRTICPACQPQPEDKDCLESLRIVDYIFSLKQKEIAERIEKVERKPPTPEDNDERCQECSVDYQDAFNDGWNACRTEAIRIAKGE